MTITDPAFTYSCDRTRRARQSPCQILPLALHPRRHFLAASILALFVRTRRPRTPRGITTTRPRLQHTLRRSARGERARKVCCGERGSGEGKAVWTGGVVEADFWARGG